MKQVINIFGKDLERLWPLCTLVLLWTILHSIYLIYSLSGAGFAVGGGFLGVLGAFVGLSPIFFPLTLCVLVVVVIQAEPLTASDAFWLTRPYSRPLLILEKVSFVAIFALLPLLLHDVVAVAWKGLVTPTAGLLIAAETLGFATVLLFVAACAVLTPNFAKFCAVAIITLFAFAFLLSVGVRNQVNWGLLSALPWSFAWAAGSAVAAIVVAFQYRTRRTRYSAAVGVAGVVGVILVIALFPWSAAWAARDWLESPALGLPQIQLVPTLDASDIVMSSRPLEPKSVLVYAVRADGIPTGISLELFRENAGLSYGSDNVPLGDLNFPTFRNRFSIPDLHSGGAASKQLLLFSIPEDVWSKNKEASVALDASLYFQAYRDLPPIRMKLPVSEQSDAVNISREKCTVSTSDKWADHPHVFLMCNELEPASGIRIEARLEDMHGAAVWASSLGQIQPEGSRDLIPSIMNPVKQTMLDFNFPSSAQQSPQIPQGTVVVLLPRQPTGLIRRNIHVSAARLRDLEYENWKARGTANFPR